MTLNFFNEGWTHKLAQKGHRKVPSERSTPVAVLKIIALIGQYMIRSTDPRPCPRKEGVN